MTNKLWSGRFTKPTHPGVEQYTASITFDHALAMEDILGSLAHAGMLHHSGMLSAQEQNEISQGLTRIAHKIQAGEVAFSTQDEDIHMNIERLLSEDIGPAAGKLHTARSRNDQVALDVHLYLRKQLLVTVDLLTQLQTTLLQLAREHRQIIVPGYTHLQRAQPIYLAKHWLAYVAMLGRDCARLISSWPRVNQSPLGAAALTGTTFSVDKHYVAKELAFDGIYLNSLDAVSDRDFVIEFIAAASLIMMHLSRLSEELVMWSSQEFNFVHFDDAFSTGSSIMPQKKNPDVVELGRGKTARVYGALMAMLTLLKGLPLAYNKDLQEDKEPLFDVVNTVQQTLSIYIPALSTLHINVDVMRQAVQEGYLNATALAEYLVKKGVPFRKAHEVVGKMVAHCVQKQCRLEELTLAEMQAFFPEFTKEVYAALDLDGIATACNQELDKELLMLEREVKANQGWMAEKQAVVSKVYVKYGLG